MAVSTQVSTVSYAGNNSTTQAYSIPFPFLKSSDLRVYTKAADEDAALVSSAAYTVTRLADGSAGSLTTASAVAAELTVIIERTLPLTQPTELQLAGPFSAKSIETAFDRIVMQIQQVNRRVDAAGDVPSVGESLTAFGRWDSIAAYAAGDMALGADNNLYRSKSTHSGIDPTADAGTNWELAAASSSVTLNVPARFTTLAAAWDFAQAAFIDASATVTIQLADGSHTVARKIYNHPCGTRMRIVGNETTPANCVLDATGVAYISARYSFKEDGLIAVSDGHALGYINGLTIAGPGNANTGLGALFAINGAVIVCGEKMIVTDFYFCVAAFNGSTVVANGIVVSGGGDGNLFAYNGSTICAKDCDSSGANTYFAKAGATIEHCSTLWAPGGNFHDNVGPQVAIHYGSTAMLNEATIDGDYGVQLIQGDNLDLDSVTYAGGAEAPKMRQLYSSSPTGEVMLLGAKDEFARSGTFQFAQPPGTLTCWALVQQTIGSLRFGMLPSSANVVMGTDGAQITFRVGMGGDLVSGTLALTLGTTKATVPRLNISNIPTSSSGLVTGDVWNNSGTLKIV